MTVAKPWIGIMTTEIPCAFQQDGVPAHTSHLVKNLPLDSMNMFWSEDF